MKNLVLAALLALPTAVSAQVEINPPAEGSVSEADGRAAWERIYEVTSHPRCANCHVGEDNIPMWSGPSYGSDRPHGMNINAGESRIGIETLLCSTCHTTSSQGNADEHMPPRVELDWQLPPVEFAWFGKSSAEICAQLSNPDLNGGRDALGLAEHLRDDASHGGFVGWGWSPGGNRVPVPYSLQEHINDVLAWGAAGMPCPDS